MIQPQQKDNKQERQGVLIAVVLLTLLGFAIRAHALAADSFWIDELITLWDSSQGWRWLFTIEDHPPLLYALSRISLGIFGESEFVLRLPSLFAGTLVLPLMVALGRRYGWPRAGIVATVLLAFSSFHLHYSQEARHYALLMVLSLATFIWLHRAISRPTGANWAAYGVLTALNLYAHYSAFIVLLGQAILIAGWSLQVLHRRRFSHLLYPALASLVVILSYSPWLSSFARAMRRNVAGERATVANRGSTFSEWLTQTYSTFAGGQPVLSALFLLLAIVGLGVLLRRRAWRSLSLTLTGLILPVPLLFLLGVTRSANPRYVIYMLPFYLLLGGIALDAISHRLDRRLSGFAATVFLGGTLLGLVALSWPGVRQEYASMEQDWQGVAETLAASAAEGDVVVTAVLSPALAYNITHDATIYYLGQESKAFDVLKGSELELSDTDTLVDREAGVWAVVLFWGDPARLTGSGGEASGFQKNIYLVALRQAGGSALEKIADLYERFLPVAEQGTVRCLLMRDLVTIRLNLGQEIVAGQLLVDLLDACPEPFASSPPHLRSDTVAATQEALERRLAQASGNRRESSRVAAMLLEFEGKEREALEAITVFDLVQLAEAERVQLTSTAPEPVDVLSYKMPYESGDAARALFLHPPASASFQMTLPSEPVMLHTRVGMYAESWEWGGDGSTFVVRATDETGYTTELLRKHVTNEVEDRFWHPVELSLSAFAGQTITLTLQTETGPSDDATGDWALWEAPRIVWEPLS